MPPTEGAAPSLPRKRPASGAPDGASSDGEVQIVEVKKSRIAPIFAMAARAGSKASGSSAAGPSRTSASSSSSGQASGSAAASAGGSGSASASGSLPALPSKMAWEAHGARGTCLAGTYGEPAALALSLASGSGKGKTVAMFDLDFTLVKPKGGKRFPSSTDEFDFQFLYPSVISKVQEDYKKGHIIVICSNQSQNVPASLKGKAKATYSPAESAKVKVWKRKVEHIVRALGVPCYVFAALGKDEYRKPHRGIWDCFVTDVWRGALGRRAGELCMQANAVGAEGEVSFFVGDAAGRAQDHNDSDFKFALNAGLRFFTPEEYFQGAKTRTRITGLEKLRGFNARRFLLQQQDAASASAPAPPLPPSGTVEVVLFCGPPGAGKSTYFNTHFKPRGYTWVNQDTLRDRKRCIEAVAKALAAGKSCVVDNTNRDKQTRAYYIELAREHRVPVRCVFFDVSKEQAWHQNMYRTFAPARPKLVPASAFTSFFQDLEKPAQAEGFSEPVFTVPFVFSGTDEQKERYMQWYASIDDFRNAF